MRVQRAGQPGQHGGGEQGAHPVAADIDAHHRGGGLVLAHRLHGAADAAARHEPQYADGEEQQAVDLAGGRAVRNAGQAEGAAEIIDVEIHRPQHLAEADGGDGEIHAGQPQRGAADDQREQHGHDAGGRQHDEERQAELQGEQRRGIGAEAHEGRLPERKLPDREHHIHRQRQQPVDAERIDDVLIGPEQIVRPARQGEDIHHARRIAARPNRPEGRVHSTSTISENPTASFRSEAR